MFLSRGFLSLEQVNNNAQSDQANDSILTKSIEQSHQIGDDPTKKGNRTAKQDVNNNPKGH